MTERRVYERPPILEAACDVRFRSTEEWDLSTPAQLYEALARDYSSKPTQSFGAQLAISEGPSGPAISVQPQAPTLELTDATGSRSVAFSPESIVVRSRVPYEGWESFRGRISQAIVTYGSIASLGAATRIGIRYVNQFIFDGLSVGLGKYFTKPPAASDVKSLQMVGFSSRSESIIPDGGFRVVQNYQSALSNEGQPAVILDIDASRDWDNDGPAIEWMKEIDALRDLERDVFESLITDEARRLFDDN